MLTYNVMPLYNVMRFYSTFKLTSKLTSGELSDSAHVLSLHVVRRTMSCSTITWLVELAGYVHTSTMSSRFIDRFDLFRDFFSNSHPGSVTILPILGSFNQG